jgi:selenocysteine lyase/cysteine desulfurase
MPATAEVFEDYSTRDLPAVLALADAIAFQARLAAAGGVARRLELARTFRDRVDAAPTLAWRSPRAPELASSLFAVGLRKGDARDVERSLAQRGIVLRPFGPPLNTLRVSPNLINTEADAERLVATLESF